MGFLAGCFGGQKLDEQIGRNNWTKNWTGKLDEKMDEKLDADFLTNGMFFGSGRPQA